MLEKRDKDVPFTPPRSAFSICAVGAVLIGGVGLAPASADSSVPRSQDSSVQMVTMIADSSAPKEYVYDFDLPEGASMEILESGLVLVEDSEGNFIAGVAAPWAKDAEGVDVPTHYEIRGSALVQIVEHRGQESVAYPVTADPWLGRI